MNEEGQIGPDDDTGGSQDPDQPLSSQQQPQQQSQQPPQQQSQQQPPQGPQRQGTQPPQRRPSSMFTSDNLSSFLGMALILGIILLFVGGILASSAGYIEVDSGDDRDLKRNLMATGSLLSAIGLFAVGIISAWAYFQSDRLTEKQRMFLVLLMLGVIIGFSVLTSIGFSW